MTSIKKLTQRKCQLIIQNSSNYVIIPFGTKKSQIICDEINNILSNNPPYYIIQNDLDGLGIIIDFYDEDYEECLDSVTILFD